MSIYTFNTQEPTVDLVAVDDTLIVYDTSTNLTKKATVAQLLSEVITAASTAAALTANGVTTISSLAAAYTMAAPVAGMRKTLMTTIISTNARTVAASTGTISIGTTGALSVSFASTAGPQAVVLRAISATQWLIESNVNSVALA